MKNILLFVYRNHVFFVFVLLEIACFSLIANNNTFHRASVLSSGNQLVGRMYDLNNEVKEYFKLKTINNQLAVENAALRSMLYESKYFSSNSLTSITDSISRQHYTYVPAKVINNTTDRRSNYLTIDRGILQGVEPEMAVITSEGIVGIVKDVSKNFATVISVLHKNSSISSKVADTEYIGSLVWEGGDPTVAQLKDIPNHVQLAEGMLIRTSGFSAMFPSGINIGTVRSFEIKPGDNFYSIEVKLLTDMNSVSMVYVVNNLMRLEQIELESQTEKSDK